AENRLGIPAHRDLRGAWEESWSADGVDVSVIEEPTHAALPEVGDRSAIATGTAMPIVAEVFRGETDAAEALTTAQQEAETACSSPAADVRASRLGVAQRVGAVRIIPSWVTVATRSPARSNTWPWVSPRPPEAEGERCTYSSHSLGSACLCHQIA